MTSTPKLTKMGMSRIDLTIMQQDPVKIENLHDQKYIDAVISSVCKHYELTPEQLQQRTKKRPIPDARAVCIYIAAIQLNIDPIKITERLKSHRTSYYHSMKVISDLKDTSPEFVSKLRDIINDTINKL